MSEKSSSLVQRTAQAALISVSLMEYIVREIAQNTFIQYAILWEAPKSISIGLENNKNKCFLCRQREGGWFKMSM